MTKPLLVLAASAAIMSLSACAGPQTRVENGLVDAGIAPARAACMAEILVDRLSLSQLKKLGDLAELKEEAGDKASFGYLLKNSKALQDPEILAAAGEALIRCPART